MPDIRSPLRKGLAPLFKSTFSPDHVQPRAALIVLSGLPGAGKSHLARALSWHLGFGIVSSDSVRRYLFRRRTYTRSESGAVYAACRSLCDVGLAEGYGVIVDATNLSEASRKVWWNTARVHGASFVLLLVHADEEVVAARMRARETYPDAALSEATWDVYLRLSATVEQTTLPHLLVTSPCDEDVIARLVRAKLVEGNESTLDDSPAKDLRAV